MVKAEFTLKRVPVNGELWVVQLLHADAKSPLPFRCLPLRQLQHRHSRPT